MTDDLSFLSTYRKLKILIAPLNWGLGHASRIIPIIEILTKQNEVIIASDGLALEWLKKEKPHLEFVSLPSYNVRYPKSAMWLNMMSQGPHILKTIFAEKRIVNDLIVKHEVNMVISDHRLGFNSKHVKSIFLGHQIRIPHSNKIVSKLATQIQLNFINRFDEIWVPDTPLVDKLAGTLSDVSTKPTKRYIGPLSRLKSSNATSVKYDIAIILSGPEPARSTLEESLLDILSKFQDYRVVLVRGAGKKISPLAAKDISDIETIGLASSEVIQNILNKSSLVICRAGYSSIMDLQSIGKNAILIPTPNQPEQEYLAKINSSQKQFFSLDQGKLDAPNFEKAMNYFSSLSK